MKALLIAALMAATISPAFADPCQSFGEIAYATMKKRQDLAPVSNLIHVVNGIKTTPQVKGAIKAIILLAYSEPLVASKDARTVQLAEFVNKVETICYAKQGQ